MSPADSLLRFMSVLVLSSPQITAALGGVLERLSGGAGAGKKQPQSKL
jgi:hypothetical protein